MVRKRRISLAGWWMAAGVAFSLTAQAKPDDAKGEKPAIPHAQAQGSDRHGKPPESGARARKEGSHGEAAAHRKAERAGRPEHAGRSDGSESAGKAEGGPGKGLPHGKGDASGARPHDGLHGSGVSELRARYKSGALKKKDLERELEALKSSRKDRRKEHRAQLKDRWGESLAVPALREELRHHGRRMARLNRALLVAETERKGAAKDKLTLRVEKLVEHENERHERKMGALQAKAGSAPAAHGVTLGKARAGAPGHSSAAKEAKK